MIKQRQKLARDEEVLDRPYKIGQEVYVRSPRTSGPRGLTKSLHMPWKDAYIVEKRTGPATYLLRSAEDPTKIRIVHYIVMKRTRTLQRQNLTEQQQQQTQLHIREPLSKQDRKTLQKMNENAYANDNMPLQDAAKAQQKTMNKQHRSMSRKCTHRHPKTKTMLLRAHA